MLLGGGGAADKSMCESWPVSQQIRIFGAVYGGALDQADRAALGCSRARGSTRGAPGGVAGPIGGGRGSSEEAGPKAGNRHIIRVGAAVRGWAHGSSACIGRRADVEQRCGRVARREALSAASSETQGFTRLVLAARVPRGWDRASPTASCVRHQRTGEHRTRKENRRRAGAIHTVASRGPDQ